MSYLSFDEISDRYNQLAQVDLTEEDLAIAEAIYLNIVNTLVEKSHTATGVLKFLETQVNDENILEFFTEESIEITEEWGDHLAKWEKDLLLFNVEGHKLELMENALKGVARTLIRSLKRSPASTARRVRAAHRSRRLGKPENLGKLAADRKLSRERSVTYRGTGSGSRVSVSSTKDEGGISTQPKVTRSTASTEAGKRVRQAADYQLKKKADQARVSKDKAAGKDPFRIKKRDIATGAAKAAVVGTLGVGAISALTNKGGSSSSTTPPPASQEPPKDTAPKGPSDAEKEAIKKKNERFNKVRAYCYQNPRKCRSMADGDYDKESMRKELSDFEKSRKSTTKEWMENYPELAQTINEQKEVTEMNNQTHDAYDIILDYLLENGHAETMDEANYVMLEMDEEHLQKIVQLSSES